MLEHRNSSVSIYHMTWIMYDTKYYQFAVTSYTLKYTVFNETLSFYFLFILRHVSAALGRNLCKNSRRSIHAVSWHLSLLLSTVRRLWFFVSTFGMERDVIPSPSAQSVVRGVHHGCLGYERFNKYRKIMWRIWPLLGNGSVNTFPRLRCQQ
jgi:hypothetical protein